MRLLVQRVSHAEVAVDGAVLGSVDRGLLVFVGCTHGDTEQDVLRLAHKVSGLRIFEDDRGKMNRSVAEVGGGLLVVSQFTLYGSSKKGFRPSFTDAMESGSAELLYEKFVEAVRTTGLPVATGAFGADMQVSLVNDGPVTLLIESKDGSLVD